MSPHGRCRGLVAGMGDTGVRVAMHLSRRVEVVAVAARPALVSGQELGTRLGRSAALASDLPRGAVAVRRLERVRVLHGEVRRVDLGRREAEVALAEGTTDVVGWDALVIASGVDNGFWRHHRVEGLDAVERSLSEVATAIAAELRRAGTVLYPGHRACKATALATELAKTHPDAAGSLCEGLDQMFTVRRLGIDGTLARTLVCTNMIESMISIARATTRNVKRWRDEGDMRRRWCAAGLLEAETRFRRVRGHAQMPYLVAALQRHVESVTSTCETHQSETNAA